MNKPQYCLKILWVGLLMSLSVGCYVMYAQHFFYGVFILLPAIALGIGFETLSREPLTVAMFSIFGRRMPTQVAKGFIISLQWIEDALGISLIGITRVSLGKHDENFKSKDRQDVVCGKVRGIYTVSISFEPDINRLPDYIDIGGKPTDVVEQMDELIQLWLQRIADEYLNKATNKDEAWLELEKDKKGVSDLLMKYLQKGNSPPGVEPDLTNTIAGFGITLEKLQAAWIPNKDVVSAHESAEVARQNQAGVKQRMETYRAAAIALVNADVTKKLTLDEAMKMVQTNETVAAGKSTATITTGPTLNVVNSGGASGKTP